MMAAVEVAEVGAKRQTRYKLIDTDVHVVLPKWESLLKYMSTNERQYFEIKGAASAGYSMPYRFSSPIGGIRRDARGPDGGPPGSDPQFVKEDLLDRFGHDVAVINSDQATAWGSIGSTTDEGVVLVRACNDFFIENWLSVDSRYRYALTASVMDPQAAVAEIRRHGQTPGVVAVNLRVGTVPFGHRHFWPLYEAAEEAGLPIYVHTGSLEWVFPGTSGRGRPAESYADGFFSIPALGQLHLISLIHEGIFERFPGLRFTLVEYGFTWLLPCMWRLDNAWTALRIGIPWIKKAPSEYIRQHVKLTTQPVEDVANPTHLVKLIEMMGPELIMFSTDYPHWDNDRPDMVMPGLSPEAHQKIFADNAAGFFPLDAARTVRSGARASGSAASSTSPGRTQEREDYGDAV